MKRLSKRSLAGKMLWEILCLASAIGIWPRYIETNLLSTTRLSLPIDHLPAALDGFKILQLSDLHLPDKKTSSFLNRVLDRARKCDPDMIVFTGDFLNYASLNNPGTLLEFLCGFDAPYGCFAIPGNHDYQHYATLNKNGDYDIANTQNDLFKGIRRLFKKTRITGRVTPAAKAAPLHEALVEVLRNTPFTLLHNETKFVPIENSGLNVTGLGEYTLGRSLPDKAFQNYKSSYPGIILAHNPDSVPLLLKFPGNIILSGHTHGAQINLPWLWKRLTLMENPEYKRGLFTIDGNVPEDDGLPKKFGEVRQTNLQKWLYVNRGLSGAMPFRWFSLPEILLLTLRKK